MKNCTISVSVLLVLVMSILCAASSGSTFAVGSCMPNLPTYGTISDAVSKVPSGSTIDICPGTYNETVNITQSLNLQGIVSANTGVVVISSSSALTPLTVQHTSGPVNISDVQVQSAGANFGIIFLDASGTLSHVSAGGFFNNIFVAVDDGSSQTVSIKSSTLNGGGNGVSTDVASGALALTVQGNFFSLNSAGVFLSSGTTATVSSNFIDASGGGNYGVLSNGGSTISINTIVNPSIQGIAAATGDTVIGNKLIGNATGIFANGAATFQSNTIIGSNVGVDLNCTTPVIATGNTFLNTGTGFNNVPSSFGTVKNSFFGVSTIKGAVCP